MKTTIRSWTLLFAALLLWSGCDFQAAEDAFDDFDLVIGLEPINTVVNGIVTDNSNDDLVAATLTFTGDDASVLIDAYSDPVSEIDAESGVVTFGIQNSVVPSAANPVEFTVTASAPGYFTTSKTVSITEPGDAEVRISLTRDNPTAVVQGTSSTQSSAVQTTSTGTVAQTTTVQTTAAPQAQTTATVAMTVQAGTRPLTKAGVALGNDITTALRAFDSARGLQSLPSAARTNTDGAQPLILGATYFKMADGAGNVAVTFDRAPGKTFGKQATACEDGGGTGLVISTTQAEILALLALNPGLLIDVYAFTPADGTTALLGQNLPVTVAGAEASVELCMGGTNANIDPSGIGNPTEGIIYRLSFGAGAVLSGSMGHMLTIQNPATSGTSVDLALTYAGGTQTNATTVPSGTTTRSLASWLGDAGTKLFLEGGTFTLTARLATGDVVTHSVSPSPLSGSSQMALPSVSTLRTYAVVASLQCANPTSQKFDVRVTDESLDAVTAMYRVAGSGASWNVINKASITSKTATDAAVSIAGSLSLLPNTTYRFKGVLGDNSADATATTPGSGSNFNIALDPDDVGLTCKSR
ncbi:MAG: hypothetical protein RIE53_05610 [Rhodothermales bacterium]